MLSASLTELFPLFFSSSKLFGREALAMESQRLIDAQDKDVRPEPKVRSSQSDIVLQPFCHLLISVTILV